jgi:HD-GYP domain-containing protein (c-di-GMP phosphodiesterase class II)
MGFALPADLDQEMIDELIVSIHEALDEVEPGLEQLLTRPEDADTLNNMFRHLHTIKGNFRMCFLEPFTDYVHTVEEIISEIRKGRLRFCPPINEAMLLGLDKLRGYMERLQQQAECDPEEMQATGEYFQIIALADNSHVQQACFDAVQAITGKASQLAGSANTSTTEAISNCAAELDFFKTTALKMSQKNPDRQGYCEQMLELLDHMQPHLPGLDFQQLTAATYIHDLGMALLNGIDAYGDRQAVDEAQQHALLSHPRVAHKFLARYPNWQRAATICLQHHEHLDGSGYPLGLNREQISEEAKVLAVIAAFLNQRRATGSDDKRAAMQALMAIHKTAETHYDKTAVIALAQAVKLLYTG